MNVEITYANIEQPPTQPFPPKGRHLLVRMVRGDYCDPFFDPDGWYGLVPPLMLLRTRTKRSFPFISWRYPFTDRGGYSGAKVYGLDATPAYKGMLPESDCVPGSVAWCLSFRFFGEIKEPTA